MKRDGLWVVKLGGSLANSSHLIHWLQALSQTNVVIVPGGGPFADTVRVAQTRWHFDEHTAHHMAIIAMQQFGRMLVGLCPKLKATTRLEALPQSCGNSKVWLPNPEVLDQAGIPATWDISSDSLAAWLAGEINAQHLLLVKSLDELATMVGAEGEIGFIQAANSGLVDAAFGRYAMNQTFQSWLCGPQSHDNFIRGLTKPSSVFHLLH